MIDFTHRIHGTEMEWGALNSSNTQASRLTNIEASDLTVHAINALKMNGIVHPLGQQLGPETSHFLSNGGRFYKDLSLWEYATPEDDSFIGTTANEFASENIIRKMAESYTNATNKKVCLSKRVIDDTFISNGYHVSYCLDADKTQISEHTLQLYGVFAAVRGALFGSGALMPKGEFIIAQKAATTTSDFDSGTTNGRKPVVNMRKEHHADDKRFLRMHDTSVDPSISPWANRCKLGAGSIVLRLVENGITLPDLRFKDTLTAISREVAHDVKLSNRYTLKNGRTISALDTHKYIVDAARTLSNVISFSPEEEWTIEEWDRAIFDMKHCPELLTDRVEWIARRKVLERYRFKHGISWEDRKLRYVDVQFSEVVLSGLANQLRQSLWADYMPSETLINERVRNPPQTTRAFVRSEFIKIARSRRYRMTADWSKVTVNGEVYSLPNPYTAEHPELDRLSQAL